MEAPIPPPRSDDDEDVHWALSTAGALWGRGEHAEALKWLRRAAEQASDVNADKRALELFKAAADVANHVKAGASAPPPPAPMPAPPAEPVAARPPPAPPTPVPAAAPPRPGSMVPPAPRGPSVPAPAAAAPPMPRPPTVPGRSAPPPVPARAPVTPPTKPVAISAMKPPAPQAVAPKRRRSFTGEARPAAEKARPAEKTRHATPLNQAASPRRRRTHADEELHLPPQPAPKPASVWDDLDEDTRVIAGKGRGHDEIDQALQRLRNTPIPEASPPAPPASAPTTAPSAQPELYAQPEPTQLMMRRAAPGVHEEPTSDGNLERVPPSGAAAARRAAGKRLDTLPALRVAVLGTGVAGEVRLISLDAGDEPPPGAALAVLVPMSGADGEAVARLFGAHE